MKTQKSSFAFFALLQLALCLPLATTQCDGSSPKPVFLCRALFRAMEVVIRTNPENMFILRSTFLSDDQPLPVLINITYEVSFDSVPESRCEGAEDDNTPLFNSTVTQDITFGWSSTALYTQFHPALLIHMQIQLSVAMIEWIVSGVGSSGSTRAFLWDGVRSLQSLTLDVSVASFFCTPSEQQVYDTLREINSLLQAYAQIEENSTITDVKYNGYTLEGSALSPTTWSDIDDSLNFGTTVLVTISVVALFILVIVTLVALVYLYFRYCVHEGSAKVVKDVAVQAMVRGGILKDDWLEKGKEKKATLSSKKEELHSIFWSFTFVLTYCSIGIVIAEFVMFFRWCDRSVCEDAVTILKFICYLALTTFFSVLGFLSILKPLPPPSPVLQVLAFFWCPIPLLGWLIYFCVSPCNRKWVKKFQKIWPKITTALFSFLPSFAFGITAASVLIGIIPTLFLAAIYPYPIITFYVFITLLVTVVAVIFVLLDNENHLVTSVFCGFLALVLLIPLLVMFASGYQMFFSGGPNALISAIVISLLPSLLLLIPVVPWVWRIWSVFIHPEEDECNCCCKKTAEGEENEEAINKEAEGESTLRTDQAAQSGLSSIVNSEGLHLRSIGKPLTSEGDANVELMNYQLVND